MVGPTETASTRFGVVVARAGDTLKDTPAGPVACTGDGAARRCRSFSDLCRFIADASSPDSGPAEGLTLGKGEVFVAPMRQWSEVGDLSHFVLTDPVELPVVRVYPAKTFVERGIEPGRLDCAQGGATPRD